jgi:hypothetical protein
MAKYPFYVTYTPNDPDQADKGEVTGPYDIQEAQRAGNKMSRLVENGTLPAGEVKIINEACETVKVC